MKILVGVPHTIENEFENCLASIRQQTHQDFEILVIKNLPLKEASENLYRSFMRRADEFDLLIKVDADMEIENPEFFSKVVEKFEDEPELAHLEVAVHDHFSDQLIWSMNVYRNTVRWKEMNDDLFVDDDDLVALGGKQHDNHILAPAASHCKNPSVFQAFHFGVHNMLKVIQPHLIKKRRNYQIYYWDVAEKTWQNYKRKRKLHLGFAVLGGELALREQFLPRDISYFNPRLEQIFSSYANFSEEKLWTELNLLRKQNWGILPSMLRKKLVLVQL